MLFASLMNDVLLWLILIAVAVNMALNRIFGAEWPKQLGDHLRAWWTRPPKEAAADEADKE